MLTSGDIWRRGRRGCLRRRGEEEEEEEEEKEEKEKEEKEKEEDSIHKI